METVKNFQQNLAEIIANKAVVFRGLSSVETGLCWKKMSLSTYTVKEVNA
jgi:hypothetical protein